MDGYFKFTFKGKGGDLWNTPKSYVICLYLLGLINVFPSGYQRIVMKTNIER